MNSNPNSLNEKLETYLNNVRLLADTNTDILDAWLGEDKKLYQRFYPIDEIAQRHRLDQVDEVILKDQHSLPKPGWALS